MWLWELFFLVTLHMFSLLNPVQMEILVGVGWAPCYKSLYMLFLIEYSLSLQFIFILIYAIQYHMQHLTVQPAAHTNLFMLLCTCSFLLSAFRDAFKYCLGSLFDHDCLQRAFFKIWPAQLHRELYIQPDCQFY